MVIINKLLEKYWAGETSLTEEAQLRDYFSGTEIADEHLPFESLFSHPVVTGEAVLSEDFDEQILAKINSQEKATRVFSLSSYQKGLSAAAAILLLITAGLFMLKSPEPTKDLAEIPHLIINGKIYYPATEAEAYELTRQALLLVSSKLTKGPKKTIQSLKKIDHIHPASWGRD